MKSTRVVGVRGRHKAEGQGTPKWLMWSFFCILGLGAILLVLTLTKAGSYYSEESNVDALIQRAEAHVKEGDFARAIDTCQLAALRAADASARTRIAELRDRIESMQHREGDKSALELAARTVEAMRELQRQYPAATRQRPASRELARMAKSWLDRFAVVAEKYPDTAGLVAEVHTVYDSQSLLARLDLPDDATDALFAVDRLMAGSTPNYRDALRKVDDYRAAHPNSAHEDELWKRRTAIIDGAQAACRIHEAAARQCLAGRRLADAQKSVQALRNAAVEKSWDAVANAIEKEIVAAGK